MRSPDLGDVHTVDLTLPAETRNPPFEPFEVGYFATALDDVLIRPRLQ